MKIVERFGRFTVATFFIMGIGLVVFLITPLAIMLFDMDTDIFGAFIFLCGLVLYIIGLVIKRVRSRKK